MKTIDIMQIEGFKVGQAQDEEGGTGCTVVLFDQFSPAGVDVRGGGPASRETPLLDTMAAATEINGILLSGGSSFGLDAAGGVMRYLEERNIGYDAGAAIVPLVCQSSLFDLAVGRRDVRPDQTMGYQACVNASRERIQEGNVGAGTGCTVGKFMGPTGAMKSGIGTYAVQQGKLKIGAIVAVNSFGNIYDIDTGEEIAGFQRNGMIISTEKVLWERAEKKCDLFNGNTTLGIIITNGRFQKAELNKIASMTHNGYARAIRPVHTTADGDTVYAVSVGDVESDINSVGSLSAYVMGKAIGRAVKAAKSAYGFPGVETLR